MSEFTFHSYQLSYYFRLHRSLYSSAFSGFIALMSSKKCNHRLPVHDHHFTKQRKKLVFACCAYVLHEAIYMRALFCEIQYFSTTSFDCIAEYFRDERKHLSLAFSLQRTCNAGVSGMPRRDMLRTVWTEQCQGKRKHHAAEWNGLASSDECGNGRIWQVVEETAFVTAASDTRFRERLVWKALV